jgi:hypothetical protein
MKSTLYKLDKDKNVVACQIDELGKCFENIEDRIVEKTLKNGSEISTVFLCIDHNFGGEGPPIVFETMIFGGPLDGLQFRCCTWDEAVEQHKKIVEAC